MKIDDFVGSYEYGLFTRCKTDALVVLKCVGKGETALYFKYRRWRLCDISKVIEKCKSFTGDVSIETQYFGKIL
jgi:hypothetical protein